MVQRILFVGLIFYLVSACSKPKAENKTVRETPPLKVTFSIVDPEPLQNVINLTGSLISNESVDISTEISGLIESIHFNEGDYLTKGALLLKLNDDELQAQMSRLNTQKKLLESTEYRQRQLLEKNAISQEEYDNALTQLNILLADISLLNAQIDKTQIRAPFNGVVGLRMASVGTYITPGTSFARFYDNDPIKIDFAVPGKYVDELNKDDRIYFTVENYNEEFEATVYAIEPQIDALTRTVNVRAITPNVDNKLVPGQFAKIQLVLNIKPEAILIPTEAVIPELNGHYVFISKNGKAERVNVELGDRGPRNIEIVTGLQANDTVLTSGMLQLSTGQQLEYVQYEESKL